VSIPSQELLQQPLLSGPATVRARAYHIGGAAGREGQGDSKRVGQREVRRADCRGGRKKRDGQG
jgi:hypothetical protein